MAGNGLEEILTNATLVLNSIAEGIYAANVQGTIIYSNPAAARILGYTVEEKFHLMVSAGVALFPHDGEDLDTLIRQADRAMYHAKSTGGHAFQLYAEMKNDKFSKRFLLEMELQHAFEKDQFFLHFQPKIHLETGNVTSAEALIRWNHPQLGIISQWEFIPIACHEYRGLAGG